MRLETERLLIRTYEPTDMEAATEFLLDQETMHYIPENLLTKKK